MTCTAGASVGAADTSYALPFSRKWLAASGEPADGSCGSQLRVISFNLLADGLARGLLPDVAESAAPPFSQRAETSALGADIAQVFEDERCGITVFDGVNYVTTHEEAAAAPHAFRCPHEYLAWSRRWPTLRDQLLQHKPDLIGLQELDLARDCCHARNILRELETAGYVGSVLKKKGRACDGVALAWRRSCLQAVGDPEEWVLSKNVHVALAQRLRLRSGSDDNAVEFLAVATHLKAGLTIEAEAERAVQAENLLKLVGSKRLPTLLLADLNSYCRPLLGYEGQYVEPRVYPLLTRGGFRSTFQVVTGDEPAYTCWGGWQGYDTVGVFDYVFSFGKQWVPRRVLGMPPPKEVLHFSDRLPNLGYPSDHISMVADVCLCACGDAGAKKVAVPSHQ